MEFNFLPKYSSTNVVEALKIREIRRSIKNGSEVITIVPEDERFPMFDYPIDPMTGKNKEYGPGEYWVRWGTGATSSVPAQVFEKQFKAATELTPELLKSLRAVVAKDLVSDDEVARISQMVYAELHEENKGVIGGPDVIHMEYPARLAQAVTEMVLNKLAATA
jgi:hypothetical protein